MLEYFWSNFRPGFPDWLVILLMASCIATDLRSRRIYNLVLAPFLAAGLAAGFFLEGWQGLLEGILGMLTGLALLFIPFARGGIGGGDVKLLAVIGGIKGFNFVINTFLTGALAGGLLALALLIRRRRLLATLSACLAPAGGLLARYGIVTRRAAWGAKEEAEPLSLPYSLALGAGVAASYLLGIQSLVR